MTKTALITGGSSGIGFELAKLFAKDGYKLILVSLLQDELEEAKKILNEKHQADVDIIQKDLATSTAAAELHTQIKNEGIIVDVLVNNAGFGTYGFFDGIDLDKELKMIQLNLVTLFQLTRLFVHDMIQRNSGSVINLASTSAFQPCPAFATYGSTKAFVYSFSKAINFELRQKKSKVHVLVTCPPATRTKFQEQAAMQNTKTFEGFMTLDPDVVAQQTYAAFQKKQADLIPGKHISLITKLLSRLLPTSIKMALVADNLKQV